MIKIKKTPTYRRKKKNKGPPTIKDLKEFLLFMAAMPSSSKKALISNVDANYDKIAYLRTQYAKLGPPNYEVLIEFNPENKLIDEMESIDLRITELKNKETKVLQDWRLPYNSDKLNDLLKITVGCRYARHHKKAALRRPLRLDRKWRDHDNRVCEKWNGKIFVQMV